MGSQIADKINLLGNSIYPTKPFPLKNTNSQRLGLCFGTNSKDRENNSLHYPYFRQDVNVWAIAGPHIDTCYLTAVGGWGGWVWVGPPVATGGWGAVGAAAVGGAGAAACPTEPERVPSTSSRASLYIDAAPL